MSVTEKNFSLELTTHFSNSTPDSNIPLFQKTTAWKCHDQPTLSPGELTKVFSESCFKPNVLDQDLQAWDFYVDSRDKTIKDKILRMSKEFPELKIKDYYDRRNLLEITTLMGVPDPSVGTNMKYVSHSGGTYKKLQTLNLWECACGKGVRFPEKLYDNTNRINFEFNLISLIESKFNQAKSQKLNFLFLGSGGCLSEWKIISQLILMGFEKLEIYLVDLSYAKDYNMEFPLTFKKFFENFPQVTVHVHILTSLEEFAQKKIPCDVAAALDFEVEDKKNFPMVELELSKDGFSFVTNKESPPSWNWNDKDSKRHKVNN